MTMPQFIVKIDLDNAAFQPDPKMEVAHILRQVIRTLEHNDDIDLGMTLRDLNGNPCGFAGLDD